MLDDFDLAEQALREYAVYLSYDRDAARKRGDGEWAERMDRSWREALELADRFHDRRPETVQAPAWVLHEARALVESLRFRLNAMVPHTDQRGVVRLFKPTATLDPMEPVVAYLRVSTARQADGYGLDVQDAAVQMWSKKTRTKIAFTVRETASGGDFNRAGLAEALGHVESGRARGGIVVARLDRLARDLFLQEWMRAELITVGAQLRSADPIEDRYLTEEPDNPTGTLVRQVLGAVAQHERAMIRLRMQAGKVKKRAAGGYVHGQPPYGYHADGHELVPNLVEQRQAQRMKRWRRDGLSLRQIANRLNDEGVPARGGGKWHPATVSRVIERPARRRAS